MHKEGETEAERLHRQQEQLLQMERERVELEKLRQFRLQEELERERIELKLHREKEQILVQRELQELQNIKEQVEGETGGQAQSLIVGVLFDVLWLFYCALGSGVCLAVLLFLCWCYLCCIPLRYFTFMLCSFTVVWICSANCIVPKNYSTYTVYGICMSLMHVNCQLLH